MQVTHKSKIKKKLTKKASGGEEISTNKALTSKNTVTSLVDDQDLKICSLCNRNRPVFVVESDNMIKRMPERYLSPLLKSLK